jgi:hypothetical protein
MRNIIIALFVGLVSINANLAFAASSGIQLDKVEIDITDKASL